MKLHMDGLSYDLKNTNGPCQAGPDKSQDGQWEIELSSNIIIDWPDRVKHGSICEI